MSEQTSTQQNRAAVRASGNILAAGWRAAELACMFMMGLAMYALYFGLSHSGQMLFSDAHALLLAPLNATVLALISFIALIVLRYARRNLLDDSDSARFLRWLGLTIAAVMVTVVSNHLVMFWLAWVCISLSLHQLLMFYPERPRAALAAHKKFILARIAEVFLAGAFFLLYQHHGTLFITDMLAAYPVAQLSLAEYLAAILIAVVALMKCAQLPLHGWLIQVVESPTPVSALLHAGIINMGGFLLLLFAPLFGLAGLAQAIVLVAAGLSMVLAALVMMTRISIKVRLAWSTTAQMGLMLVEIALGLYELALLHLLAHSCYKAYAFLSAGGEVNRYLQKQVAGNRLPGRQAWCYAAMATAVVIGAGYLLVADWGLVSPWVMMALALFIVLATRYESTGVAALLRPVLLAAGIIVIYGLLKWIMQWLFPGAVANTHWFADFWISLLFIALFAIHTVLRYRPATRFSQRLFITLNAGFYLDEWASHWTLRLWPARLPSSRNVTTPTNPQEALS